MNLFLQYYTKENGSTTLAQRKLLATKAFHVSSNYDTAILITSMKKIRI